VNLGVDRSALDSSVSRFMHTKEDPMAGIKGRASKVGGFGGTKIDFTNPLTGPDASRATDASDALLSRRGKGRRPGSNLLSAVKGAGVAAVRGRKAGGINIKGGKF
jgi:gentisate 1,2-dioxygenase